MGKEISNSEQAFAELKAFTDKFYTGILPKEDVFQEAYRQLLSRGTKLRQDDGRDPKMTISVPRAGNALVVGIRYRKNDGRSTEDHFIFRPGVNIYKCKTTELDRIYPEYKGSHTLQPPSAQVVESIPQILT